MNISIKDVFAMVNGGLIYPTPSKCFTYVTKTIANLTTYSRKLGDYSCTIIFKIDIMKNPNN